jgi:hypothetical protein
VALSKLWKGLNIDNLDKLLFHNTLPGHDAGTFKRACGVQYFISSAPANLTEAYSTCCKYGMKLLSIESREELECIVEMSDGISTKLPKFLLQNNLNFCVLKLSYTRMKCFGHLAPRQALGVNSIEAGAAAKPWLSPI